MQAYKCDHAGIVFKMADERYTLQTCSSYGSLPDSRPNGIAGLGMRGWPMCALSRTIAISTRRATFSQPGMAVSQEESLCFKAGRYQTARASLLRSAGLPR